MKEPEIKYWETSQPIHTAKNDEVRLEENTESEAKRTFEKEIRMDGSYELL
jgi:hypothetical protein